MLTTTNQNPLSILLEFARTIPVEAASLVEGTTSHRAEQLAAIKPVESAIKAYSMFLDNMNRVPPTTLAERAAAIEAVHTLNDAMRPIICHRMYSTRLSMATYTWEALNYVVSTPQRKVSPQGGGGSARRVQVAAGPAL